MTTEITNTVSRFFAAVDRCEWAAVQALMTDPFNVNYTSYANASAGTSDDLPTLLPAEIVGAW